MSPGLKTILQNAFIVASLCLGWNPSHSQGYLEAGYKVGLWLNAGGMNRILREFNTKNPWQKFNMIHTAHGGRIMYGAEMNDITFFTGLDWIRTVITSSGIDPATNQMSYRKLVVHNGGIGFGLNMKSSEGVEFGFETNVFNFFAVRGFE